MSSALRVIGRREVGQQGWDALVEGSGEAWLWHSWDMQESLGTWRASHDESFGIGAASGELIAVVPLRALELRLLRTLRAHDLESLGGPAFRDGVGRGERTTAGRALVAHLRELGTRIRAREARLTLSPLAPSYRGPRCPRVNPALGLGGENLVSQTWLLRLSEHEDELWERMEGRMRTAVRKARKEGVTIREAGPEDLDAYYRLHRATYLRTGEVPHPRAYFEAIWARFLSTGRAMVLIAEREGAPLAMQNFALYKGAGAYWTGAASEEGLRSAANNLLQWTALGKMVERGIAWYEAGEAFPGVQDGKLKGLSDFKRSTGGELYPLYRVRFDTSSRALQAVEHLRGLAHALRATETAR